MKTIKIQKEAGAFCENKDVAKKLRENVLLPTLKQNGSITFDFDGVTGATQSFIHALISEALRRYPEKAFEKILYKNTNPEIRQIISIVYTYMQQN